MESDQGTSVESVSHEQSPKPATCYTQDENYYFEDGSIVLLLGNRLFKIHKTLFTRRSDVFDTMLSLPQGPDSCEGQSDEDPIVCHDTPEDFRALCWVVYASPQEILAQQDWEKMDAEKLIAAAVISHKYEFTLLRDWALDVLEAHAATHPGGCISKFSVWDRVGQLLILARQCKRDGLASCLENDWSMRIVRGERSALRVALDTAESCPDLRAFHARAYYSHLQAIGIFGTNTSKQSATSIEDLGSCTDETASRLSKQRQLHIHHGFWSLSLLKSQLSQAPKLSDSTSCLVHDRTCIPVWQAWWKKILKNSERGPGEILAKVYETAASPIHTYVGQSACPCDDVIRAQARKMVEKYRETLPDRFMIP